MPFSTYLRDTDPTDVRSPRYGADGRPSQQQQQQQQYAPPPHGIYSYDSYYPLNAHHTSIPISGPPPSSSPSTNGATTNANNDVDNDCSTNADALNKPYVLPQPSPSLSRTGSDGLFQLPSFLMGNFGGTLAPGGGAEVLTPSPLGMFDFASTPFPPHPHPHPHPHDDENGKSSWQSTKYYILQSADDVAETTSPAAEAAATPTALAPLSASTPSASEGHVVPPAASPFGYLYTDSPRDHQVPQLKTARAEDDSFNAADIVVSSPVEPSLSAMTEPGAFQPPLELYAPVPSSGLPVYSQSGFDMLSILARVARRPNPTIVLGPVDLTCAFVVADVRRADAPIVYASRTFCELTGYSEGETLGQNCRFLQAPGGRVMRNEARRFTSAEAVRELRFALDKDREVQVSLINYRKDGRPFVNRVSIVPIPAEDDASEIAFHVGFQVDLNEQPGLIAQRIQDGKFYSGGDALYKSQTPAERSARAMGKKLRTLLSDDSFQSKVPISTSCNSTPFIAIAASSNNNSDSSAPVPNAKPNNPSTKPDSRDERQWLNLVLLQHMPDFVHVLSFKGHFLYVSPAITRVLGYSPEDLIGKSVGDFCHPSDAVPLLRELKESAGQSSTLNSSEGNVGSSQGGHSGGVSGATNESQARTQTQNGQRVVNLLFRMRTKAGEYVWIESIGRLHVEASKGRKAIVLSGRSCAMPNLRWGVISQAGGLLGPSSVSQVPFSEGSESSENRTTTEQEFWAMLCEDGLFLVAGMGVRDLLGWGTAEIIGRSVREFILDDNTGRSHSSSAEQVVLALSRAYSGEQGTQTLTCQMKKRDGEIAWMQLTLYANESRTASGRIIIQFKLLSASSNPTYSTPSSSHPFSPTSFIDPSYPFSFNPPHSYSSYSYNVSGRPTATTTTTTAAAATAGRILHQPNTNVFAEFETHRGTSWQYELQQLKYANDKLRQEVTTLEARQRRQRQQQQQQHQQQPQPQNQQVAWVGNVQA
ncbi:hypothetical protein A7U60_g4336 [Sanghuangporus baumii]|uniref:PAS domain-containing protein n=1 Tax=Sanghuangporus baumii TaxID=108892 RepID=A0A9Q5HYZ5_SANBA|nr:hypothetical protein A7U60_g4336 [Sanghuangporus baumii]